MPDRWGNTTTEDWLSYANQLMGVANQIQRNKAYRADAADRASALKEIEIGKNIETAGAATRQEQRLGALEGGQGTTVLGSAERARGALENPAQREKAMAFARQLEDSETQNALLKNRLKSSTLQHTREEIVTKTAEMDNAAKNVAATIQPDLSNLILKHGGDYDKASSELNKSVLAIPSGVNDEDKDLFRKKVNDILFENWTRTAEGEARYSQAMEVKAKNTMDAVNRNIGKWSNTILAARQNGDVETTARTINDIMQGPGKDFFGGMFEFHRDGNEIYGVDTKTGEIVETIDASNQAHVDTLM